MKLPFLCSRICFCFCCGPVGTKLGTTLTFRVWVFLILSRYLLWTKLCPLHPQICVEGKNEFFGIKNKCFFWLPNVYGSREGACFYSLPFPRTHNGTQLVFAGWLNEWIMITGNVHITDTWVRFLDPKKQPSRPAQSFLPSCVVMQHPFASLFILFFLCSSLFVWGCFFFSLFPFTFF